LFLSLCNHIVALPKKGRYTTKKGRHTAAKDTDDGGAGATGSGLKIDEGRYTTQGGRHTTGEGHPMTVERAL